MKPFAAIAIIAGLLGLGTATPDFAMAADAQISVARRSTDFGDGRLFPRRYAYDPRYARTYQPTYYARPIEYRPYGLVPFFFGLSFPYRTP